MPVAKIHGLVICKLDTLLMVYGIHFIPFFQIASEKRGTMKMAQRSKSIATDVPALAENGFAHQNFAKKSIHLIKKM